MITMLIATRDNTFCRTNAEGQIPRPDQHGQRAGEGELPRQGAHQEARARDSHALGRAARLARTSQGGPAGSQSAHVCHERPGHGRFDNTRLGGKCYVLDALCTLAYITVG